MKLIIKNVHGSIKIKDNWNKFVAIGTILLAIATIWGLIISSSNTDEANNLSEKLIALTPSKYSDIDVVLARWSGGTAHYSFSSISSNYVRGEWNKLKLDLINTGKMNTDKIIVTNSPPNKNFSFDLFEIMNIEGGDYNLSNFLFNITKEPSEMIGEHIISLRIFCQNCIDQGNVIYKDITLEIYNESAQKQ